MKYCFSCKKELEIRERPGRLDSCRLCGADLKVCVNCRFYDKGAYNMCREPRADKVVEKERANFCDYFEFRDTNGYKPTNRAEEARKKLEELFRKS